MNDSFVAVTSYSVIIINDMGFVFLNECYVYFNVFQRLFSTYTIFINGIELIANITAIITLMMNWYNEKFIFLSLIVYINSNY